MIIRSMVIRREIAHCKQLYHLRMIAGSTVVADFQPPVSFESKANCMIIELMHRLSVFFYLWSFGGGNIRI